MDELNSLFPDAWKNGAPSSVVIVPVQVREKDAHGPSHYDYKHRIEFIKLRVRKPLILIRG